MGRLFGTDGVRGVANKELTPELAFSLGRAAGHVLAGRLGKADGSGLVRGRAIGSERQCIMVGRDTRLSGTLLEAALAAGIASAGVDVLLVGVVTTPALAYLVRETGVTGGAMISASHNPAEYNGIKFFTPDGYKLPDEKENVIESLIRDADGIARPTGADIGRIEGEFDERGLLRENLGRRYVDFVCGSSQVGLSGLRLVLDCANGAAFRLAPEVFRRLGAEVVVINNQPDGMNINAGCGSLHPQGLQEAVVRFGADAGLAFDGDADRVIAVDETGAVVDGDRIMAIAARSLLRQGRLAGGTVVATVMSNLGLEKALAEMGVRLVRTKVGDRYVLEAMRDGGYVLGGEQSGHIIFLEHTTTGDGILTGVQLMSIMKEEGLPLSRLAAVVRSYPQVLVNVRAPRLSAGAVEANERVQAAVAEAEAALGRSGRILVRPSGTEPIVRVMVEGEDLDLVRHLADRVAGIIREELVEKKPAGQLAGC